MAEKTIQIADKPTVDEILALLENAEVGLAALRLLLGNSADAATMNVIKSLLENGTYGLAALKNAITGRANETTVATVKALLENGTYGLNALKTAINKISGYPNISNFHAAKTLKGGYTSMAEMINISGKGKIRFLNFDGNCIYRIILDGADITAKGHTGQTNPEVTVNGTKYVMVLGSTLRDYFDYLSFEKSIQVFAAWNNSSASTSYTVVLGGFYQLA